MGKGSLDGTRLPVNVHIKYQFFVFFLLFYRYIIIHVCGTIFILFMFIHANISILFNPMISATEPRCSDAALFQCWSRHLL